MWRQFENKKTDMIGPRISQLQHMQILVMSPKFIVCLILF